MKCLWLVFSNYDPNYIHIIYLVILSLKFLNLSWFSICSPPSQYCDLLKELYKLPRVYHSVNLVSCFLVHHYFVSQKLDLEYIDQIHSFHFSWQEYLIIVQYTLQSEKRHLILPVLLLMMLNLIIGYIGKSLTPLLESFL